MKQMFSYKFLFDKFCINGYGELYLHHIPTWTKAGCSVLFNIFP